MKNELDLTNLTPLELIQLMEQAWAEGDEARTQLVEAAFYETLGSWGED
jgi:hypothetical protein